MSKKHKVLLTVLVVGLGGALAGFGVFAAFSSTTSNPGNTFEAGSVTITDNDADAAMFTNASVAKPDTNYDKCIKITYGGTLDADVKMYADSVDADGSKINITVHKSTEAGQATDQDCSDFVADGAAVYSGNLSGFGTSHSGWANGLAVNPASQTKWVSGDELSFRVRLSVSGSNNANQGALADGFNFTWEARNQ